MGLLRCCTAFEAYCQVYTADLTPDRILEFLLLNRDFPHAIRYCVDGIRHAIESIQHTGGRRSPDELTAGIGRLHAMLGYTTIGEILDRRCRRVPPHHPRAVPAHSRTHLPLLRPLLHSIGAGRSNLRIRYCMNFYSIRHLTRFRYSQPISESIMETRMHPRSDSSQHCLTFSLSVSPRCRVFSYRDHLGNNVQHFDIPGEHNQLVIVAESVVEQQPLPDVPGFLVARCLGCARRPDRIRRLLGDAAAQHICRGDAGAVDLAGEADGRHPPRRSAHAGAGAQPAPLRLLRIRAPLTRASTRPSTRPSSAARASARTLPTP